MTAAGRGRRSDLRLLVVCAPGLEAVVAGEVAGLGLRPGSPTRGGVPVAAGTRDLYRLNLRLRTATRVLVRVGTQPAPHFDALAEVAGLDWDRWLPPGAPIRLRVTSHASRLYHTGAVAERLHDALRRPASPADDQGSPLVLARLSHDKLTLSVDASGEPLHRRGWRLETAKAPLRPTLAAAMLLACGWQAGQPVVDPMCGSGTIAIEAAQMGLGIAAGAGRSFAFERWPCFEPGTWASVQGEASAVEAAARAATDLPVVRAADRDPGAVAATSANAARAGVADVVVVTRAVVSDLAVADGAGQGWVVTNPPWGARVGGGDPRDLVARLGQVVSERAPAWGVALLVPDARLARALGGRVEERWRTTSGGAPVRLFVRTPGAVSGATRRSAPARRPSRRR